MRVTATLLQLHPLSDEGPPHAQVDVQPSRPAHPEMQPGGLQFGGNFEHRSKPPSSGASAAYLDLASTSRGRGPGALKNKLPQD